MHATKIQLCLLKKSIEYLELKKILCNILRTRLCLGQFDIRYGGELFVLMISTSLNRTIIGKPEDARLLSKKDNESQRLFTTPFCVIRTT